MSGAERSASCSLSEDDRAQVADATGSDRSPAMSDAYALRQRCRIQAKVLGALEKMVASGIVTATNQSNMNLLDRLLRISQQFKDTEPQTALLPAGEERQEQRESEPFKCPVCRATVGDFQMPRMCPNCGVAVVSFGQGTGFTSAHENTDESVTMRGSTTRRLVKNITKLPAGPNVQDTASREEPKGRPKWTFETKSWVISSPVVVDDTVYFGSFDSCLYAVDANSGGLKWKYATHGQVWSSPVVTGHRVIFGSADGRLYSLDRKTGELEWRFDTAGPIRHSVAVARGMVYCGSEDGHLYALDVETGHEQWSFKAGGPLNTAPVHVDGLICFGSADGHLYVLN